MNNQLQIFNNQEFGQIRTLFIENEGWLVGKDITDILGYSNSSDALKNHVDEDDKKKIAFSDYPQFGNKGAVLINESGLYSLILRSNLPKAKKFKRWVTSEVLPSIRNYGAYMTENTLEKALTSPDFLIQLATNLKEEQEKRRLLEEEKERNAPKVIFADAVSTSHTSILVGELAKLMKQNGIDTGEKRLFKWLRDNGYLIKRKGTDYNMPTQKSLELKIIEIKERTINNPDGSIRITKTPKITGKGQQYFINKFLN
ncbi:phage antirepressor [Clostridium perfringens]|uniref:phage antirepressor n=1 Tax=Clostridium perfringens TaxID=1502 RepID=UPI0001663D8C|nr:phage antirepressor [Clostridium perfringens]EDS79214.1 phage antirepressor protein [Clostridium perfringens C str. JGS1495]ELC8449534.1 phage antirepressor [Clostridium perfringens]MBI6029099.1 phage antirepressor KilAC domain-containing protein [Clostridium perfringens]MBI6032605.1 phage antirepressor KilAC domain-containing protein [Clostridium perfringens]MBI6067173.1 phage antirepressor KilAC domain-containing protein [Clostridium perfringens]